MILVGLCGKMNSGKGEVSKILVEKYGFIEMSMADTMKCISRDVFEIHKNILWGGSDKRTPEVRGILQSLGAWGRNNDPDIWVKCWERRLNSYIETEKDPLNLVRQLNLPFPQKFLRISVPDIRFPNEAEHLMQRGGYVFRVLRPKNGYTNATDEQKNDVSETRIDKIPENNFYTTIQNTSNLTALRSKITTLIEGLLNVANH